MLSFDGVAGNALRLQMCRDGRIQEMLQDRRQDVTHLGGRAAGGGRTLQLGAHWCLPFPLFSSSSHSSSSSSPFSSSAAPLPVLLFLLLLSLSLLQILLIVCCTGSSRCSCGREKLSARIGGMSRKASKFYENTNKNPSWELSDADGS